jgi:hypothetical protein
VSRDHEAGARFRRALILLWAVVLVDFSILGHHHQQLDRHIRWEERERGREWERVLSGRVAPEAVLGDTAAPYRAEHQRLHRWRSGLRWAIAAVLAAGAAGTIWLLRRHARESAEPPAGRKATR